MDVVEGTASQRVLGHVALCARCRARSDEARSALAWSRPATVPEPVPAYWDVLRRRVALGLAEAPPARRQGARWTAAALAAAAMIALTVVPISRVSAPAPPTTRAAVIPAWSPLPPDDEDDGLAVLEHAAPTAAAAAPGVECADVAECVVSLTDEESHELADALRDQLARGRTL
jgi:hypothetical protein